LLDRSEAVAPLEQSGWSRRAGGAIENRDLLERSESCEARDQREDQRSRMRP